MHITLVSCKDSFCIPKKWNEVTKIFWLFGYTTSNIFFFFKWLSSKEKISIRAQIKKKINKKFGPRRDSNPRLPWIMKGFFFAVKESVWLCSSVVEVPQLVPGKYGLKSRRSLNFFSGLFSVSCLNCGSYFRLVFKKFQKFISWKNHENGLVINCLQYVKSVKTCSQVP